MAVMDYSQQQRVVIDGTGRILDTTMSNPNVGSWVSEAQLKTWINTGMATDADLTAEVAQREADTNDLKNAIDSTNARVENLEQEHGSYHDVDVKSVYTIPSGKAKNWSVNVLRGVTRARNNLLANGNFASATGWSSSSATFSVSDNVATVTPTGNNGQIEHSYTFITGHTYLVFADVKLSSANATTRILAVTDPTVSAYAQSNTNWQQLAIVCTVANGGNGYVMARDNSSQSAFSVRNFVITDLNIYFGTSDLSFLGATDSAKLATIQTNYPELLVPSNYGNSLVSTRYEGVKSKGSNRMSLNGLEAFTASNVTFTPTFNSDGELEYLTATGTSNASGNLDLLRYDNFKLPYGTYFLGFGANNLLSDILVNVNGTWVTLNKNGGTITVTDPSQAIWVRGRFASGVAFGGAKLYPKVNIGSTELTFSPYFTDTLSLPTPITLRSAGTVAEVFDLESGEKTNPLGVVDLGSLNWEYIPSSVWANAGFRCDSNFPSDGKDGNMQVLCAKYLYVGSFNSWSNITDQGNMVIGVIKTARGIVIRNDSYTSASDFKTAMSGVMLYYELATPLAPTQLSPIQNPYLATESGGTISSILTDAVDDSMTLGYINL